MKLRNELQLLRTAARSFDAIDRRNDCIELVRSGNPYDLMFFSELLDPRWLPLLRRAGMFEKLPRTVVRGDRKFFARAVPLIGLATLAPIAPAEVVDVLESLNIPDNPQVHDQIMRVIRGIGDLSLTPRLVPILQRLFESRSPSEWLWLDDILRKWLDGEAYQACFDALAVFLRTVGSDTREHGTRQIWQVGELDRNIMLPLSEREPARVASLLFDVLQGWANAERAKLEAPPRTKHSVDPDSDYPRSYWLEEFGKASIGSHDFESTVAQRLYQIGRTIYKKSDPSEIDQLDDLLRSDRWHLFHRMRWQWYADFPTQTLRFARRDVLERIPQLNQLSTIHPLEFAALLEMHATENGDAFLTPGEVCQFADSVFSGPLDENGDLDINYRERFFRLQLHPIRILLLGDTLRRYNELSIPDEVPPDVYKPFSSTGGGGAKVIEHVSPVDEKRLAELSDRDLWDFLNTWEPAERPFTGDRWWVEEHASALGNEFAKLVEADPIRFRVETEWWRNIKRPEVLSKLMERATNTLDQNPEARIDEMTPEWQTRFGVAAWITEQATTEVKGELDTARVWSWPKILVVKFLRAAIRCKGAIRGCANSNRRAFEQTCRSSGRSTRRD